MSVTILPSWKVEVWTSLLKEPFRKWVYPVIFELQKKISIQIKFAVSNSYTFCRSSGNASDCQIERPRSSPQLRERVEPVRQDAGIQSREDELHRTICRRHDPLRQRDWLQSQSPGSHRRLQVVPGNFWRRMQLLHIRAPELWRHFSRYQWIVLLWSEFEHC